MKVVFGIVLLCMCGVGQHTHHAPKSAPPYDWGIAYYMAYDNNLEKHGQPILQAIEKGTRAPNIAAAVQADFTDDQGMRRYTFNHAGTMTEFVKSEDSADANQVVSYVQWFAKTYPCRKLILVLLDHGGKLDQMCCDKAPATAGKEWILGSDLGPKLRTLKKDTKLPIELLFLQQCGRGSIENLYSFRDTAAFVMSSPVAVDAPNTYYTSLHPWLAKHPNATGDLVARKIADEDKDYTVYTCARGDKLNELPRELNRAMKPFLQCATLRCDNPPDTIHSGGGETVVDLRAYLQALEASNRCGLMQVNIFLGWLDKDLLSSRHIKPRNGRLLKAHCGLSLWVPQAQGDSDQYQYLDLYKECRLGELWKKLYTEKTLSSP